MKFHSPQMLYWLLGIPLLWVVVMLLEKRSTRRFNDFLSEEMRSVLLSNYSSGRKKMKVLLLSCSLLFVLLALARPQMGVREETLSTQGLDIVFCLDVSNSMLTEDMVPSRLKKAKHVMRSFLDRMSGDRVGVVAFAGSAYPAIPLTTDYDFIKQSIEVLDQSAIQNQGTDLNKALNVSYELLTRGGLNEPSTDAAQLGQVIIVLSDGEDQIGAEAEYAKKLKAKGVRVYSIGVGSLKGGPIPMRDEYGNLKGYKKEKNGNIVLSRLEANALKKLAESTEGKYFSASTNEGEVDEIMSDTNTLDRKDGAGKKIIVYDEYYQYPLGLALLFLFWFLALLDGKKTAIAACLLLSVNAHATGLYEYKDTVEGNKAYENKDYPEAIQRFSGAQAENPDSSLHPMNLGDAFYESKAYEEAAREFEKVFNDADPNVAAKGAFNEGMAYSAMKNPDLAMRAYQKGLDKLKTSPKPDAETMEKLKIALENAQQQKQNQKDKKDDKEKQDKGEDKEKKQDPKDQKDEGKKEEKEEPKQFKNPKQQFKAENLKEEDAQRILKQLQEQEKKTQNKLMQKKSAKDKEDSNDKDW